MSESTSAPAGAPASAPASTPAPAAAPGTDASSPPPASQPSLSLSEAARLLRARRGQGEGEARANPPAQQQGQARANPQTQGQGESRANVPARPAAGPADGGAPRAAADGPSAMERALGLPEGAAAAAEAPADAAYEIEGARYTQRQLKDAIAAHKDYTYKSQQLAEQTRQLESQRQSLAMVLPYIQPELQKLQAAVEGAPRPDPSLLETDPGRYLRELAAHERAREEQSRLGNLTALQQQAQNRVMEQQLAAANEQLAKEYSFWADPEERAVAQRQIVDWATTQGGFSHDELRGLTDPRALKLMMKARHYDMLMDGTRTKAPTPSYGTTPVRGSAPPPAPTARISAAMEAFEARPSVRSGAALLAARRGNGSMGNTH